MRITAVPNLGIAMWLACFCVFALADEHAEFSDQQRMEHLAKMKSVAASIHVLGDAREPDSEVKLLEEPVLRYSDNTRLLHESSLWVWSAGGRPSAILAVEFYPKSPKGPRWLFEIASTSTNLIAADRGADLQWKAKEAGLQLETITDADQPADKASRRLLQMKEIRRRFTAHETAPVGGRIELRPLSSPLLRYADEKAKILDGAIFAFANGTNPEVLMLLEAHSQPKGPAIWRYGLVQTTGASVSVSMDGKEIWERSDADPPAIRPSYVNGWISSEPKK